MPKRYFSTFLHSLLLILVATVGLEKTYYPISEDTIRGIEICVTVNSSSVECPIEFPFAVNLTAIDGTAGMQSMYGAMYINEARYDFILSGSHGL